MHHLPYGTLSVACALMLLSMISVFFVGHDASSLAHHAHDHALTKRRIDTRVHPEEQLRRRVGKIVSPHLTNHSGGVLGFSGSSGQRGVKGLKTSVHGVNGIHC